MEARENTIILKRANVAYREGATASKCERQLQVRAKGDVELRSACRDEDIRTSDCAKRR